MNEGLIMMPLSFATAGEENIIKKIGGKPEVKKHLENLGFVVGGDNSYRYDLSPCPPLQRGYDDFGKSCKITN